MEEQSKRYQIIFTDRILDNVHGLIKITEVEKRIIRLPLFRRLQNIKQLSLVNRIFPGSEHTRYSHSLGVMHIADKMALQLNYSDEDRQLIRLAGLLHDIGHYPLSHVGEFAFKGDNYKVDDEIFLDQQKESIQIKIDKLKCQSDNNTDDYMKVSSDKFHHERIGAKIIECDEGIHSIILELCPFIQIDDIIDIITGNVDRNSKISDKVQIMHSELDADGLDYLLRDAKFSGTSFGNIELDYLIDNLVLAYYEETKILAIKPKGIAAADQYLISKFFAYLRVIYNKHTSIIDYMAEMIVLWLQQNKKQDMPDQTEFDRKWIPKHNSTDNYLQFTDNFIWNAILNIEDRDYPPQLIMTMIDKIKYNKEVNCVSDKQIISTDKYEIVQFIESSAFFENLHNGSKTIPIMHIRKISKHVPFEEFQSWFGRSVKSEEEKDEDFIKKVCIRRLQDGIAVADKDLHLLSDDTRSLIRHLYKTTCILLREYSL